MGSIQLSGGASTGNPIMIGGPTGGAGNTIVNYNFGSGRFKPPTPNQDPSGDILSGFSHRFKGHLEVADKDGRTGLSDEQTKYDVAFLQL